jgi:hypothetical protein
MCRGYILVKRLSTKCGLPTNRGSAEAGLLATQFDFYTDGGGVSSKVHISGLLARAAFVIVQK